MLNDPNRTYAVYTLYLLLPLVLLFIYFVLEAYLVVRVLGEKKPLRKSPLSFLISLLWHTLVLTNNPVFLLLAVVFFAVGQVFNFVISTHICQGVNGKIDGSLFQTLFTLLAVVMVWVFWSSITEDDWEQPLGSNPSGVVY